MNQLVLASHNPGKQQEFATLLAQLPWQLVSQTELGLSAPAETGLTFIENALIKARHAALHTGCPAIADDSGLIVDALNGAPGLYSARYAGEQASDEANNAKLLQALTMVPDDQRTARFYSVIVILRHAHDPQPLIAEGTWEGIVTRTPCGHQGFGYNPVFFDPRYQMTAAQMDSAMRQQVSHRAQALQHILAQLATWCIP